MMAISITELAMPNSDGLVVKSIGWLVSTYYFILYNVSNQIAVNFRNFLYIKPIIIYSLLNWG